MCSACEQNRLHTPDDWAHHPFAGHGFNGSAWTHPELVPVGADPLGEISGEVLEAKSAPAGEAD